MGALLAIVPPRDPVYQLCADRWVAVQHAEEKEGRATLDAAEAALREGRAKENTNRRRVDLGAALIALKAQTKHGEWLKTLADLGIEPRTAQNYMRLAGYQDDKNETDGDVSHLLAGHVEASPEKVSEERTAVPTYAEAGIDKRPRVADRAPAQRPPFDFKKATEEINKDLRREIRIWPPSERWQLIAQLEWAISTLKDMGTDVPMGKLGDAKREFLAAAARPPRDDDSYAASVRGGWCNERVIEVAAGRMTAPDPAMWDPVSSRYGACDTFDRAFDLLARAAEYSWGRFDITTLRECRGLSTVQLPTRVMEGSA
jgi:hypothetical protein